MAFCQFSVQVFKFSFCFTLFCIVFKQIILHLADKIREALGNIKAKRLVTKKESEKKGKKRKMKKTAPKNNVAVKARIEKEKKKKKLVHLGWKHYDPIKGKYVQVRGDRGGGTIKVRLDWETDYHQLLQRMLDTFFPEGRSPLGVLEDINYSLGIYNSDEDLTFIRTSAGVLPFTLRDHFNLKKGDYHIRFYLYTTFKRAQAVSQSEPQISAISPISPLHDDSSVSSVDPLDDLFVPSSEEEAFKQRIGAIVNASQQFPQPYETSDAHTSEGNNANTEEFEMVEPPVSFRDGPSTSFMEVVVTAGPSSNSTSNGNMSGREERLQQSVDSDGEPRKVMLHRINIFNELIDVFSDPNILNESLYFVLIETNGREEKGQDTGGVYRDVLTTFWQTFCNSCCTGEAERVPALRHDFQEAKWQCCARVLLKGFMDMRYWPLQLCHAFLCHSLFGMQGVTDEMLCNSFQSFVDVADAKVITSIMEDKSSDLDETLIEEFQDMLSRYNGRKVATKENVKSLVVELAHKELIQSPKYISAAWAPELLPLTANHEEFFSPISFLHFMARWQGCCRNAQCKSAE
eukprot:Seg2658.2 transcript_id=Seg2658.2/GoldUCD/mRNA.D3Y31 product="hypothetical protein" protein_id=Seg2658.2/GoldUCD/D3Y31